MRHLLSTAALLTALALPVQAQHPAPASHPTPHPAPEAPPHPAAEPEPTPAPPILTPAASPPAEPAGPRSLSDILGAIDTVDSQLLGLLNQRAALVTEAQGAETETNRPAFKPGRRAALLRRLAVDNRGPLPSSALARIWTEIIGASIRTERPLTVAFAGHETIAAPLAVEYFGSGMTMVRARTPGALLDMVATDQADVGVVELDAADDSGRWWRRLPEPVNGTSLRVVARLPFLPPAPGHVRATGFVVARFDADPSGHDKLLLAVDADAGATAKAAGTALGALGWRGVSVLDQGDIDSGRGFLVEADQAETLPPDPDPASGLLDRVVVVGRYAAPLAAGE